MAKVPRECPCFSGARYLACCAPLHRAEGEASSPVQLMRSRYAAFVLGLGAYLVQTLASDHSDRALPAAALARELARARERQRFLGLRILHADADEVLFYARIFEKGADRSFVELSRFVREDGAWRYASGIIMVNEDLPQNVELLTPKDLRR